MTFEGIGELVPIDESDCCGNGCANCVLNIKPKSKINDLAYENKLNIILNYTKFRLVAKDFYEQLPHVLELHFKWLGSIENDDLVLDVPPGHHIMLRFTGNKTEDTQITKKNFLRPYSPFWTNALQLEFKILVNLKPQGSASHFLESVLDVGMDAEFRGPIGSFQLEESNNNFICIITQGVAIAPTIPIIDKILQSEENETRICHLVCGTDLKHIYFRKRLLEFSSFWNYKSTLFLAHQPCEQNPRVCTSTECKCFPKKLYYKEIAYARKLKTEDIINACAKYDNYKKLILISGTRDFQNSISDEIKTHEIVGEENLYLL